MISGGGQGYTGPTTCTSGWYCAYSNPYYSQCLPGSCEYARYIYTAQIYSRMRSHPCFLQPQHPHRRPKLQPRLQNRLQPQKQRLLLYNLLLQQPQNPLARLHHQAHLLHRQLGRQKFQAMLKHPGPSFRSMERKHILQAQTLM